MKIFCKTQQVKLADQNEKQHLEQEIDREKVQFDDLTVLSNDHPEVEMPLEGDESMANSYDLSRSL